METKVEALEDSRLKVTVTVDEEDVDLRIRKTYKDFSYRYNFPGFRKGKAPRPIIDNALGKETVLASVTEELINETYPLVIEEEKLFPVGEPTFDTDDFVESGQPFTFDFTLSVKPEYELTSYDPVAIELPVAEATEKEVEDQVEALREHYANYEDADDDQEVVADSYVDIDIVATDEDGQEIPGLTSESRLYGLGTGMLSSDFNDQILGLKKGDEKEFTLEVPEGETAILLSDQEGKTVDFKVTVNGVKERKLPEITDEWAKDTMGFEDLADFRQRIAESIEAQKADFIPRLKESRAMQALVDRFEGEVPEAMAEDAEANLLQDFFTQLQRQGVNFDTYLMQQGITSDQFKEDVKAQAQDNVKQELALDAWARHHNIGATEEDISAEFEKAGLEDPEAVESEWRKNGRLYLIREAVIRSKASDDVLDSAVVTEVDYAAQDDSTEDDSAEEPAAESEEKPEASAEPKKKGPQHMKESSAETETAAEAHQDALFDVDADEAPSKGKHAGAESKSVHAKHAKDDDEE